MLHHRFIVIFLIFLMILSVFNLYYLIDTRKKVSYNILTCAPIDHSDIIDEKINMISEESSDDKFVIINGMAGFKVNDRIIFPIQTSDPEFECYLSNVNF